jgi:hypothetical protein
VPATATAATDLDLISFLKAIPDARMRKGIRIPASYLLLVAVLGILSKCESVRDLALCSAPSRRSHRDAWHPGQAPALGFGLSLLLPAGGCGVHLRRYP